MKKVLVAYATRAGSTGEIAEFIGKRMGEKDCQVDVLRVDHVKDISGYDMIIVGTAARMAKVYAEAVEFVKKFAPKFGKANIAYFYSGVAMKTDTPEGRKAAQIALAPMLQIHEPSNIGYFGGNVDPDRLKGFWKFVTSRVKDGEMAPGDFRDWAAIETWADELAALPN